MGNEERSRTTSLDECISLRIPWEKTLLQGTHSWEEVPREDSWYIAGMDVAGEDRPSSGMTTAHASPSKRDSSVITIGRVSHNELGLPTIEVVHHEWWTGRSHLEQYAATVTLVERWGIRSLVVDATGIGAGLASLLLERLGPERVTAFTFSRPSKSRLAYQLLTPLNSGRLKLYVAGEAPHGIFSECWHQLQRARYRLPAPDILDFYVDPTDGHDDFLISLALLSEAAGTLITPAASSLVRPVRLYTGEGKF